MLDLMDLKRQIIGEVLDDLADHDGMKLKPKAAISITAVKPEMTSDDHGEPDGDEMPSEASDLLGHVQGDEDDDDELLKELLQHRLAQQ